MNRHETLLLAELQSRKRRK